jgi:hypothetical protein
MTRIRVVTPELLDGAVAALINTSGTQSHNAAVVAGSGGGTVTTTGVTTATANTLVQRDANARTQFASPSVSADAATKGYVDTTCAGYIPTTQKGAASGVASLDGSSFLTAAQVPQYLHQHRGSGTSFPTGIRAGDTYLHTGFGCLFTYNGTGWKQAEEFAVANLAGRDALKTNYPTLLHVGLRVWQTDISVEWMWTGSDWTPTNAGQISGKLYGPGAATFEPLASNGVWAFMHLPTYRGSGGIVKAGDGYLTLPVDGLYRCHGRGYLTSGSGQAEYTITRTRAGVADSGVTQSDVVYKPSAAADQLTNWDDIVPLKAGDTLWMQSTMVSGSAMYWYMNNEFFGSNLTISYHAPLNGATPL